MNYSNIIQAHFEQPQNIKHDDNKANTIVIDSGATAIGGYIQLFLQIDDKMVIHDAQYKAYGCPVVIALGSWLTAWLIGKSLLETLTLTESAISAHLQLAPHKKHLASLAVNAIKKLQELMKD